MNKENGEDTRTAEQVLNDFVDSMKPTDTMEQLLNDFVDEM